MKNILMISYSAPPQNIPSAVRTGKLAKHFKKLGWNPIILTVKNVGFHLNDNDLLDELSEIEIIRTDSLDPLMILKKFRPQKNIEISRNISKNKEKITSKFKSIFPIDDRIGWMPFCLKAASKIIREHKIDAIYTFVGGINHPGISAYKLSKKHNIPYFIEFHDLWANHPFIERTKIDQYLNDCWEKKVVKSATGIITLAPGQKKFLENKYPFLIGKTIFNLKGFDAELIAFPKHKTDKLTITFCGSLYKNMTPKNIFDALLAMDEIKLPIKLKFIGDFRNSFFVLKNQFENKITNQRIKVEVLAKMSYTKLLLELQKSDAFMLFLPNEEKFKAILHAKLYDYIVVGKPILAFAPKNSDVGNFVNDNNLGFVAEADNLESGKSMLSKLITEYQEGDLEKYQAKPEFIQKNSRKNAAKKVIEFIEENINE